MRAQLRIDFQGRSELETFSRTRVQPMRDGVQRAPGIAQQVRALGQVLAQRSIRVLAGPALPGAVRIGKEHPDCEPLVFSHLLAQIVDQSFAQRSGYMQEFLREAFSGTPRIHPVPPGQDDQACGPFTRVPTA